MSITEPTIWNECASCLVWYAVFMGVSTPVMAIASGTLWGPAAFIGGAFAVGSALFGDLYLREARDAV